MKGFLWLSWWIVGIVGMFWDLYLISFSSYPILLLSFYLLVEAVNELTMEKTKTGILLNSIFIPQVDDYFVVGTFFSNQKNAVYSKEQCKGIWPRVSFWRQEAYLFQACMNCTSCQRPLEKMLFLYLFILFHVFVFIYVFGFFKISYLIPTNCYMAQLAGAAEYTDCIFEEG